MEIREIKNKDIDEVVDIWYEASINAHNFIPKSYWEANKNLMKSKYIPVSETYLAINEEKIMGFVAIIDEYLAAIFVRPELQGKGIGSSLLAHVKNLRGHFRLKVYSKNRKSIEFYRFNGFSISSDSIDNDTEEKELIMEWHK